AGSGRGRTARIAGTGSRWPSERQRAATGRCVPAARSAGSSTAETTERTTGTATAEPAAGSATSHRGSGRRDRSTVGGRRAVQRGRSGAGATHDRREDRDHDDEPAG